MKREDGTRKISIIEAAWIFWAEKGGKWNGGKAGKLAAGKKGKKADKSEKEDETDGIPGVGLKACNAYKYDENGDRKSYLAILDQI